MNLMQLGEKMKEEVGSIGEKSSKKWSRPYKNVRYKNVLLLVAPLSHVLPDPIFGQRLKF
jgi:hypothetical protein